MAKSNKKASKAKTAPPEIKTTMAEPKNRMMRYRKNPPCPKCDAHPVICMQRRGDYAAFRCRTCGHWWEVA